MPAVLAGIAGAVAAKLADKDDYKDRFDKILMMMYGINVLVTVYIWSFASSAAMRYIFLLYIAHVNIYFDQNNTFIM